MNTMTAPNQAVEAAAKAIFESVQERMCSTYGWQENIPGDFERAKAAHYQSCHDLIAMKISELCRPLEVTAPVTDAMQSALDLLEAIESNRKSRWLLDPTMDKLREALAAQPQQAVAAPAEPVKKVEITLDFKQATELLEMFGGEPCAITLIPGDGHSGKGLYAYWSEMPEEGAEFLGDTDEEAQPASTPVVVGDAIEQSVIDLIAQRGGDSSESVSITLYKHRWKEIAIVLAASKAKPADAPVGKIVLFGEDLKEVSWGKGKMPPAGTTLYSTPAPALSGVTDAERLAFLHRSNQDPEGYEYGICRVKVTDGDVSYLWAASDHSDIDAIILRQRDCTHRFAIFNKNPNQRCMDCGIYQSAHDAASRALPVADAFAASGKPMPGALPETLAGAVLSLNTAWNQKEPEDVIAGHLDLCRRLALDAVAPQPAQAQGDAKDAADMFWDNDDSERQHGSIEEMLNEYICDGGLEVGAELTIQQAYRLPNIKIRVTAVDDESCEAEYEIIDAAIRAQGGAAS